MPGIAITFSVTIVVMTLAAIRRPIGGVSQRVQYELTRVASRGPSSAIALSRRCSGRAPSRRALRRRDQAVAASLPELCDVLGAALRAGSNLSLALEIAEDLGPPIFGPALAEVRQRVAHGERLIVALHQLPTMLGDGIGPITGLLQSAERDGIALARLIDALAADARRERRQLIERNARRLPVLLLGPLVGCVLPAFMILTVVPVVIASMLSLAA
ncbi:MAG: type II secretion system F family protein [Acidimicrobiia bacterium]